ncbi:hypothetical protein PRIPAC_95214 [Pristionchus pacificus]|uniref:Uncharacterized protein n=1 Tax=Pristionchus pacificus TaxID=54126 RepID=A0A2A6BCB7_PRIPA|nr:hypothetical protein PRIPAC_95214 [Pristionchus pacificus]|eukprot:PDM63496.1 hypothetical protein PRIPAC_53853 [Pristionchus pacificus]
MLVSENANSVRRPNLFFGPTLPRDLVTPNSPFGSLGGAETVTVPACTEVVSMRRPMSSIDGRTNENSWREANQGKFTEKKMMRK